MASLVHLSRLSFLWGVDSAPTPTTTTSGVAAVPAENAASLQSWLLVTLLILVVVIILAMFALSAYSLSAPRSTLKNILGQGRLRSPPTAGLVTPRLVSELATSARGGRRTTRTTLAVGGFSILFVVVVAVFGLNGEGVRDLRSQVVASVTTLVAAIAGFYFGAQTAGGSPDVPTPLPPSSPQLRAGLNDPHFKVGRPGNWAPALLGSPSPTVKLAEGSVLPPGLELDPATGAVRGTPTAAATQSITLIATNGVTPDAILKVAIVVD